MEGGACGNALRRDLWERVAKWQVGRAHVRVQEGCRLHRAAIPGVRARLCRRTAIAHKRGRHKDVQASRQR